MNNLAAFSDVVNGIRQALINLNAKIDLVRADVTALQTKVDNIVPSLQEAHVRQWIAELEDGISNKLAILNQQCENLKCLCTPETQNEPLTIEVVQNLVDISIAKLLEGVQPVNDFEATVDNLSNDVQEELPPSEPVSEVTIEPVVPTSKTPKKANTKRGGKKS
jgi:outer membrane murein-binding lipoprotein Lpp